MHAFPTRSASSSGANHGNIFATSRRSKSRRINRIPPTKPCAVKVFGCWAEARIKIARMTLTIKLDGNWSSFQLANNTPPLSVTGSVIAPSARMSLRVAARHVNLRVGRRQYRNSGAADQTGPKVPPPKWCTLRAGVPSTDKVNPGSKACPCGKAYLPERNLARGACGRTPLAPQQSRQFN